MEAKKSKPRKAKLPELPFYQKYLLTMDETAVYFRIGSDRMRMPDQEQPGCKVVHQGRAEEDDQEGYVCPVAGRAEGSISATNLNDATVSPLPVERSF